MSLLPRHVCSTAMLPKGSMLCFCICRQHCKLCNEAALHVFSCCETCTQSATTLVQDAMETAAQSADSEIAEELLHYFVDNGERECFAASLYTCYDLIKPDVAMEVRHLSKCTCQFMGCCSLKPHMTFAVPSCQENTSLVCIVTKS